jgi:Xaa-Pro dipeptidase
MTENIFKERQQKLRQGLDQRNLSGAVLNPGPDLKYMTGLSFHLMERPVVAFFPVFGPPVITLPELEKAKLDGLDYDLISFTYSEERSTWIDAFRSGLEHAGLQDKLLGVIPRRMRLLEANYLKKAGGEDFCSAQDVFASLRMKKNRDELIQMKEAVRIAECALQAALSALKLGVTEKQFSSRLVYQLLHQGSEPELPFFPIVSFGENSANPHAAPGDRELQFGDIVLIDWGANFNGYYSDLTRTFAMGDLDPVFEKIADFVRKANRAAREAVHPGVKASEVDQAARRVIEDSGYSEYFIHRTGHGLGIETHEEPYISADDQTELEPGMTFTIEPGIYLANRGGIRIEDDVVVTEKGVESLSTLTRELGQLYIEE